MLQVLLRALVLVTAFVGISVGIGTRSPAAGLITLALVGPALHVVAAWFFRREDRILLVRMGIAYPVLSGIVASVWVGRSVSVALGVLLGVATFVLVVGWAVHLQGGWSAPKLGDGAVRRGLDARPEWQPIQDVVSLRSRWPGRKAPVIVVAATTEVDGVPVTAFDTRQNVDDLRRAPVTTWVVELPVALPRILCLPWLGGGPAPRSLAELQHRIEHDPDRSLAASTYLDILRKTPPWQPALFDPSELGEEHLVADTDDHDLEWTLLTDDVRRTTIAGGVAGWQVLGRDLVFSRPTLPADGDLLAPVAERLVAVARALPADVLARADERRSGGARPG